MMRMHIATKVTRITGETYSQAQGLFACVWLRGLGNTVTVILKGGYNGVFLYLRA